jgi:HEAT repeat protein
MGRAIEKSIYRERVAAMIGRRWLLVAVLGVLGNAAWCEAGDSFGGKTSGEWLKILREHKDAKVRSLAILALGTIGPKATGVTPGLLDAMRDDPEPEIRREIAALVGRLGNDIKGAVDALGERLINDKSEVVRQAAATALGGKLAKDAEGQVRALANALKDKHEGVRRAAAETLKNMGELAVPAVPQLIDVAKDTMADRYTRTYAVLVIGQWGRENKDTGPTLVAVMGEKDAHIAVRQVAADGLGRLGDYEPGVTALGQALASGPPGLRESAATALAQVGEKGGAAWPAIKGTFEDKKSESTVRFALIRAVASQAKQQADAVPLLVKVAQADDAVENRLVAVQELGELGSVAQKALPALEELAAGDARASIRQAAEAAVKKIKGA